MPPTRCRTFSWVQLEQRGIAVYRGEAPPRGHLQLGDRGATMALGAGEPLGAYRVEAKVCDAVASRCLSLVHPIRAADSAGDSISRAERPTGIGAENAPRLPRDPQLRRRTRGHF